MSRQANVSFRIDEDLKTQVESLFAEFGMNMTTAFTIYAKAVVRQGKIPFEIAVDRPNIETLQAIEDASNNKNLSKKLSSTKDLMRDLDA